MHSFMSPRETPGLWLDAFNAADADRLTVLYHEDAVNHQVANAPVEGREAIREMFRREFAQAEMVCIPDHILCDGEWVVLEWKDPLPSMNWEGRCAKSQRHCLLVRCAFGDQETDR
jgi:hypothetical protein